MDKLKLISPENLDDWISQGKQVNILDVRPSEQRKEENIPGSIHTDQYFAIKEERPDALSSFYLDKSIPVVTFCNGGKVANTAAILLTKMGYEAYSLEGGLNHWKEFQQTKNIFNRNPEGYDAWFDRHPVLFENELKAIQMALPSPNRSLEIGVGTGRFAKALGIGTGLEPSAPMAQMAKERGIEVIEGYAENLPFPDSAFDNVVMITTICFLKDIPKAFEEAKRVLKTDGNLIIGMNDNQSSLGKIYEHEKESNPWYKDAHFYSVDEINGFLKQAGFSEFKYYQILFSLAEAPEFPKPGYGEGSFVVIKTTKP
ncbi:MAG: methyltransferase domain-containing protein [Cyclobacteriaceae bacterium]|nr:methyltransferase domain-containing protein [Cyclobacteriaceae bacterium]